ncbi:MAG: phnA protein [Verrucomicrobiae bacterium]|nr:phnA protein [Verrucomicrobiae bacterium]
MAKGYESNQERVRMIASFGKDLARRARSRCELCETTGVKLTAYEVPPEPKVPDFDRCLFLCDRCREQAENPKRFEPGEEWRCLAQAIWSEVPAVQVMAVRLLRRQADSQNWARETLEQAYLDPEIETWADQAE